MSNTANYVTSANAPSSQLPPILLSKGSQPQQTNSDPRSPVPSLKPATKPVALKVLSKHIPNELKQRAQWVCWRYELRDGKWTKVPHQTNGRRADSTKSNT
jgi:hypothetical protein